MDKVCRVHGLTPHSNGGGSRPRCRKCLVIAVTKRRQKLKLLAVEYKGGSCERCGYNRSVAALQFHHRDPADKDFSFSVGGYTRSWEALKLELDKCLILCANCHAEEHYAAEYLE